MPTSTFLEIFRHGSNAALFGTNTRSALEQSVACATLHSVSQVWEFMSSGLSVLRLFHQRVRGGLRRTMRSMAKSLIKRSNRVAGTFLARGVYPVIVVIAVGVGDIVVTSITISLCCRSSSH